MLSRIAPSLVHRGWPRTAMSASICPGRSNSAQRSPRQIRSEIAWDSGGMMRKSNSCRSPMNVSDCQSTDRTLLSRILSRGTHARAISERSRADAAGDIANFSTGLPPGKPGRGQPFEGAGRGLCADRKRNAGPPSHSCRTGWEELQIGAKISLPL